MSFQKLSDYLSNHKLIDRIMPYLVVALVFGLWVQDEMAEEKQDAIRWGNVQRYIERDEAEDRLFTTEDMLQLRDRITVLELECAKISHILEHHGEDSAHAE